TWIGGYWDDDDFDNAVIALSSSSAIHVPAQVDAGAVGREAVARVDSPQEASCRAPVRSAVFPRAPPVDSPTHSSSTATVNRAILRQGGRQAPTARTRTAHR